MDFKDLTEEERGLIETMRLLGNSQPEFKYLPKVLHKKLLISLERGSRYNGSSSGPSEQMFYMGDQSAYHAAYRPIVRMRQVMSSGAQNLPDEMIQDMIDDSTNYLLLWDVCREHRGRT